MKETLPKSIQELILSLREKLKDEPEIVDMFERCYSNTLDTTVKKMEDGSTYAHEGKLQFAGVTVNTTTGAVTLRALVPNPERLLMPGISIRSGFGTSARKVTAPVVVLTVTPANCSLPSCA